MSRARVRRRRLVATLAVAAALLATRWLPVGPGGGPLAASGPETTRELTTVPVSRCVHGVQPGDTLWSIARDSRPEGDVRPLVDRMSAERRGRPLVVGERVAVP